MKWIPALSWILLLLSACRVKIPSAPVPDLQQSVFEAVISDFVAKEPVNSKFVGSKVMVVSEWNEGDSLFYGLNDELKISKELIEALESAAELRDPFPSTEILGPNAVLTPDPPRNYLDYYDDKAEPVQAKCFVGFWRPGYSKDGKQAIVRAWYGPKSHDAVATYLLKNSDSGWTIQSSTLSEYP
jgi:hypothetical protein